MITKLTSKPFYGTFFKKVTVCHNNFKKKHLADAKRKIKNNELMVIFKDIRKLSSQIKKMDDTSTRKSIREGKMIIYFNDDSVLDCIPDTFTIIEYYKPFDNKQIILQKSDNLIEIKNKLYHRKYRYKICFELSKKWGLHNKDIKLEIYNEILKMVSDVKITHSYPKSSIMSLYIDCGEDIIFYLKLKYEKLITNVFQAVLVSEL